MPTEWRADLLLMHHIQIRRSFECPAHPDAGFCRCEAARTWTKNAQIAAKSNFAIAYDFHLINNLSCFLSIEHDNGSLFKQFQGHEAEKFIGNFLDSSERLPAQSEPANSRDGLKGLIAAYWVERAKTWRAVYAFREEAGEEWHKRIEKANGHRVELFRVRHRACGIADNILDRRAILKVTTVSKRQKRTAFVLSTHNSDVEVQRSRKGGYRHRGEEILDRKAPSLTAALKQARFLF